MKIKFILLACMLSFYMTIFQAQDRLKYIGIETGVTFIQSELSDMDCIRGDIPSYYLGYSTNSLISLSNMRYAGVKSEFFSLNDRMGLSAGIRFSRLNSIVGKRDYWANSTDYFYWLYRQDGVDTEYLKIREIGQKSDYIGVPIEFRYFPARRPRLFHLYFKIGLETDYLIKTRTDIHFKDEAMDLYENDIIDKIKQPHHFSAAIYGGGGFRIGSDQKPSVSIEACMPYLILTSKSTGMLNPIFGGGFQFNLQIPIKSKLK